MVTKRPYGVRHAMAAIQVASSQYNPSLSYQEAGNAGCLFPRNWYVGVQ
jgi:hypothetical protein